MLRILFFDGVCVMCNGLVDFVLKHDHHQRYQFAPLQGSAAKKLLPKLDHSQLKTVILLDETGIYSQSDAIIRLLVGLGGMFRLAIAFKIFPKVIRDSVYRLIAAQRYRWFGKNESCRLPTPKERERILL